MLVVSLLPAVRRLTARMHLKGTVSKHGGKTTPFLTVKGVTHIIAENLSGVKTDKAMKVAENNFLVRLQNETVTHRCRFIQQRRAPNPSWIHSNPKDVSLVLVLVVAQARVLDELSIRKTSISVPPTVGKG